MAEEGQWTMCVVCTLQVVERLDEILEGVRGTLPRGLHL